VLKEIVEINSLELPKELSLDTNLIGSKGILDSLAFVSFLITVEQRINQQFNKHISLNSEKAFSQSHNPFRSVGTLVEYIKENWEEDGQG
jgi:acyl carrier protein